MECARSVLFQECMGIVVSSRQVQIQAHEL